MLIKISIVFLMLIFLGCDNSNNKSYEPKYSKTNPHSNTSHYIFGVHPLHNPKRLHEVYEPLVNYINSRIPNIELKLEASKNYESYNKKLFNGHFDFALPNPYQTVQSLNHGYEIFGKMGDDFNFKGIILVRKDSDIKDISDLKGKTISYPAPTALAATMLPQYYLHKNGIDVNKDIKNIYVGSQESSIMSVYLKKSDAAATWPPPWFAFIKERPELNEELEIKWSTKSLPNNGLVYKKGIDNNIVEKIGNILFTMHENDEGKKILNNIELSKFESASKETYNEVIDFLLMFEDEVKIIRK